MIEAIINTCIHIILLFLIPPSLLGIINKTKAWFAGRKGAPFLQPYYDIGKLLRKGFVQSTTTTWVFKAGPAVVLSTVILTGLFIPLAGFNSPLYFTGDMILFAYLFGLARFFTTSAALDTGSAFEGMGSAREVTFAVLSEPALFFAFLTLVKLSGSFTLNGMLKTATSLMQTQYVPSIVLISIGLFIVLLTETCRIPVDDPTTHLELTMIHEAMVLDHSGPLFGIITYASAIKLFVLGSLLLNIAVPFRIGIIWADWLLFVLELFGLAVVIGCLESITARLKMRRVPVLLVTAFLLCGSSFILLLR